MTVVEALYASFYQNNLLEDRMEKVTYTFKKPWFYKKLELFFSNIPFSVLIFFIAFELILIKPKLEVFAALTKTDLVKQTMSTPHNSSTLTLTTTPEVNTAPLAVPLAQLKIQTPAPTDSQNNLQFKSLYKAAGARYKIPWQILYGLHFTETSCGTGAIYNNEGSGAKGPMQFMPETWRVYGIDGDGDGYANINNVSDAVYSAANYLSQHGSLNNALTDYGTNVNRVYQTAYSVGY